MYSLAFPKMFNSTTTRLFSDHEATSSNLKLLLKSEKYSLFGDPYFGTSLKKLTFEQNNIVLQDLVIDDIYLCLQQFIPQIYVDRRDITVDGQKDTLYATIKYTNIFDKTVNLYQIDIMTRQ